MNFLVILIQFNYFSNHIIVARSCPMKRLGQFVGFTLITLGLGFVQVAHSTSSEVKPQDLTIPKKNSKKAHKKREMQAAENLSIQRYVLDASEELGVEFRYVGGKLRYVYLWNTGKPLEVEMFSNDVVLGENNDVQLDAPNLDRVLLVVSPYNPGFLGEQEQLFKKTYLFSKNEDGTYELNSKYYPHRKDMN